MLKEFAGPKALAAINAGGGIGLIGELKVTDTEIALVFTKQYSAKVQGPSSFEKPQYFKFDAINVSKDTVDSGALFYAVFEYKMADDTVVKLGLRFFPSGRAAGGAMVGEGSSMYVAFLTPLDSEDNFMPFLKQAAYVYLTALNEEDPLLAIMGWGAKTYDPPVPIEQ